MEQIHPLFSVIVNILGEPGKVNHTNSQYGFNCIECSNEENVQNDGKYNLEVNLNQLVFKCWKCGDTNNTHGSLKKLIRKYGSKIDLKNYLSLIDINDSQNNNNIIKHKGPLYLPKEITYFKNANKNDIIFKEAINYLYSRGLNDDIIYKYNMGYCKEGKYENRIIIPSYDINNKLNYFVSRTYVGDRIKYKNPSVEKDTIIINEKSIDWNFSIFLVEGIFDMIALHPIKNIIPLLGKNLSNYLYYSILKNCKGNVYIILDNDAKIDMYRIYKKLQTTKLKDRVRVVELPNNGDLSDIRRDFGKKGIIEILKTNRQLNLEDFMEYEI